MADVIRKALQTIILYRDGSQKVVEPGEVITLTDKEFNELRQINPECMSKLDEAEIALMEKQEAAQSAPDAEEPAQSAPDAEGPAPVPAKKGANKAPVDEDL